MKTLATGMQTHVEGHATSLTWGLKITRRDGEIFAFTSDNVDTTIDGVLYRAGGLDVRAFANSAGLGVANNQIVFLGETLNAIDAQAGIWDGATYQVFQYNRKNHAHGRINFPHGRLANIEPKFGSVQAELRDLRQALQADTGRVHQELCPYRLGVNDGYLSFCPVDAASFTVPFTVTSISAAQRVFGTDLSGYSNDWFGLGVITWLSGENAGLQSKVIEHIGATLTLAEPLVLPLQVGDTGEVLAGCRKRIEDCRDKFDALLDFGGDPDAPTSEDLADPEIA